MVQRSGIDTIKYHTWPRIPMGKWQTHRRHHKREPRGQPFPSRWPQSTYKQTHTKHSKHKTEQTLKPLNPYMTLSSADNPFKQIGPRSGSTFRPDLIGVQTVWPFTDYDKLKLNRCILTLRQSFTWLCNLLITLCKQFGPRSGSTFCQGHIGVQTVWHFKGYDKLKLNRYILTMR